MNLLLVSVSNGRVTKVQYMISKWERELGDIITYNGIKMRVAAISDDMSEIINFGNELIKRQNKETRALNKRYNIEFWEQLNPTF